MATRLRVRFSGMEGSIHFSSQPRSMMVTSLSLIAIAGFGMEPRVQAPSQGAGQTRPVNSGKLFVSRRRRSASSQRPRYARSFHSGMRLWIGQPETAPS
jgi:hypothetical protein